MTAFTWLARLVAPTGEGIAGVDIEIQVFDVATGWRGLQRAVTNTAGRITGTADDGQPEASLAPLLRLAKTGETAVPLAGVPQPTRQEGGALSFDFGEITNFEATGHFTLPTAAPRRRLVAATARATAFGGLALPAGTRMTVAANLGGLAGGAASADLVRPGVDATLLTRDLQVRLDENTVNFRKLQVERDGFASRIEVLGLDVRRAEQERNDLRGRLEDAQRQIAELRATATATTATDATANRLAVGDLAARLGGEVDSAQTALKRRGFSLGSVNIKARGVFDGNLIKFPTTEEIIKLPPGSVSEVDIRLDPDTPETRINDVTVPSVLQLTESAARRVLASVGLGLEVLYGPPEMAPGSVEGQAMRQVPGPGAPLARGSAVAVIFVRGGPGG